MKRDEVELMREETVDKVHATNSQCLCSTLRCPRAGEQGIERERKQ